MDVSVSLSAADYWAFANRFMKRGHSRPHKSKALSIFITLSIWMALALLFLYLFREFQTTSQSFLEVFWPAIAVLVFVGVLTAYFTVIYRRRMTPLPDGFVLGKKHFTFSSEGFDEVAKNYKAQFAWPAVIGVVDDPQYIFLVLDNPAAHIIPKRVFESPEAAQAFVRQIEQWRATDANTKRT